MPSNRNDIVYLNGNFLPITKAKISVLDRGFLLGDGVYEVISVYAGKPWCLINHLNRLQLSIKAIQLNAKISNRQLINIITKLLKLNNALTGAYSLYLQITRGVQKERAVAIPKTITPTIFLALKPLAPLNYQELHHGKSAVTAEDIRWKLCHIKSISLLPTILLLEKALQKNANETILIRDGHVIEGTSSNVFIVKNGRILTPPLSQANLSGTIRALVIKLIKKHRLSFAEKNLKASELKTADEVWITSSSRGIFPITKLDGKKVANGKPGPIWEKMIKFYLEELSTNQNYGSKT